MGDQDGIGHNHLAALAADIRALHAGIRRSGEQIVRDAIEAGRQLIEAKSLVSHGEWEAWLRQNVAVSPRTACRYMKLARSGLEIGHVADLGFAAAAEASEKASSAAVIHRCVSISGGAIAEIGRHLRAAKAELGGDRFPQWVADNFDWTGCEVTEQLIAIADEADAGQAPRVELDLIAFATPPADHTKPR